MGPGLNAIASASNNVKRINGIISPVAAAAIGLEGRSEVSQPENVCPFPPVAISAAAAAAPAGSSRPLACCGSIRKSIGASGITTIAVPTRRNRNTNSVRPPMRPIDFTSEAEATPTTRSDTTNGITVMRIALTHSVPIGVMKSAARTNVGIPDAAMATPLAIATARATRTRVLSFKINSD